MRVAWDVLFYDEFEAEFDRLPRNVQDELLACGRLLEKFGPKLGRPHVDTLEGSLYANMKELRFKAADGEWRVAFAFDRERRAVLLAGGNKIHMSKRRFYSSLVRKADARFGRHLEQGKKGT